MKTHVARVASSSRAPLHLIHSLVSTFAKIQSFDSPVYIQTVLVLRVLHQNKICRLRVVYQVLHIQYSVLTKPPKENDWTFPRAHQ
jgi:hypothetical protein